MMKTVAAANADTNKTYLVAGTKLRLRILKNKDADEAPLLNTIAEVEGRGSQQISAGTELVLTDDVGFKTLKEVQLENLKKISTKNYVYRTHIRVDGKILCGGGTSKHSTVTEKIETLRAAEKPCSICLRKVLDSTVTEKEKAAKKVFLKNAKVAAPEAKKRKRTVRRKR